MGAVERRRDLGAAGIAEAGVRVAAVRRQLIRAGDRVGERDRVADVLGGALVKFSTKSLGPAAPRMLGSPYCAVRFDQSATTSIGTVLWIWVCQMSTAAWKAALAGAGKPKYVTLIFAVSG